MSLLPRNTLPDFVHHYLHSLEKKERQPSTIRRYAYDLEEFFVWVRAKKGQNTFDVWRSLSPDDLQEYIMFLKNEKEYSERTLNRIITVLKRFNGYYDERGYSVKGQLEGLHFEKVNDDTFSETHFITELEEEQLLHSIASYDGLSDNQLKSRHYLIDRNIGIIKLLLSYGLTLHELTSITMNDIRFEKNQLYVHSVTSLTRTITLKEIDKKRLFSYYHLIPEPVRPRYKTNELLFVAFDFRRDTYRWDYSTDSPKGLTEIAVQKMIRQEVERAGLRKGISAQHLRRTFILRLLQSGEPLETIQSLTGFKTGLSLNRYAQFAEEN